MVKHTPPPNVEQVAKTELGRLLSVIEGHLTEDDVVSITGPLFFGIDHHTRMAIEAIDGMRRPGLLIILDTAGGLIEIAERIVETVRRHYSRVRFLVPDRAMSAGTILAMSGDAILMDYFSCLGPIDPQVEKKDGGFVPALSYLEQYDRLITKASNGSLTTPELILLEKLDLAELHRFELQRDLSVKLIEDWLTRYKFKSWSTTESRSIPVTADMRRARGQEVARKLSDHKHWGSHGRGITKDVLTRELNLKIDDFGADPVLAKAVRDYHWFLKSFMMGLNLGSFAHSRDYI